MARPGLLGSHRPGNMRVSPHAPQAAGAGPAYYHNRHHPDQIDFRSAETWVSRRQCHEVQVLIAGLGIGLEASAEDIVAVLSTMGINLRFAQCPVEAVPRGVPRVTT